MRVPIPAPADLGFCVKEGDSVEKIEMKDAEVDRIKFGGANGCIFGVCDKIFQLNFRATLSE